MQTSTTITIPSTLVKRLESVAKKSGMSKEGLYSQVVKEGLDKYELRMRLERVMEKAGQNARKLGIKASDVPKIVKEFRKKK